MQSPNFEAAMLETRVNFSMSFGVTSVQLAPPLRVRNTLPSSEPVQMVFAVRGDSSITKIVP